MHADCGDDTEHSVILEYVNSGIQHTCENNLSLCSLAQFTGVEYYGWNQGAGNQDTSVWLLPGELHH